MPAAGEVAISFGYSSKHVEAVVMARTTALRLCNSVLAKSGAAARLVPPLPPDSDPADPTQAASAGVDSKYFPMQLGPATNPTLELMPTTFETPAEEKHRTNEHTMKKLQLALDAKCAWTRVTTERRVQQEVTEALAGLLNNPAVEVSTALKSRFESITRQRSAVIDLAMKEAQLIEAKLALLKVEEHELHAHPASAHVMSSATLSHVFARARGCRRRAQAGAPQPAGSPVRPHPSPTHCPPWEPA